MNISDVNKDGIAMDGMDPVAHFNGEPLQGDPQYGYTFDGLTYHFANPENMELFSNDPAKYIPMAGGYKSQKMFEKDDQVANKKGFVGETSFDYRRNLEDSPTSKENNVPIDIKEDGDIEMQNLSDSQK